MSQQVIKITEEQLQALLASGALEGAADEMEEVVESAKAGASKISIGIHAKSTSSLPNSAVDIVRFVQVLQMNLNISFAVDVNVGVNPTLAVPQQKQEEQKKIGFSTAPKASEEDHGAEVEVEEEEE